MIPSTVPTILTSVAMHVLQMFTIDFALKDEIFKDPCFHTHQPSNYPLLPLITVNYPNQSLNLSQSCEVCCQEDDSAKVDFYQTDPTLTDEIKLYHGSVELPPLTWTVISQNPLIRRANFHSSRYIPGNYEIRTINRYGSTSVKFTVYWNYGFHGSGCLLPLFCEPNRLRPGRQIVS